MKKVKLGIYISLYILLYFFVCVCIASFMVVPALLTSIFKEAWFLSLYILVGFVVYMYDCVRTTDDISVASITKEFYDKIFSPNKAEGWINR